jgi:exonuclease VII large subunit
MQVLSAFADTPTDSTNISTKLRDELIGSIMEEETRNVLTELFTSQRNSLEELHESVQKLQNACSFMIRQPDKRKRFERVLSNFTVFFRNELITEHKDSLRNKLEDADIDPPTTLLLIVLFLFAQQTDSIVHASGKFVGPLIKHLASLKNKPLASDIINQLNESQRLVIECLKKKNADEALNEELRDNLEELKSKILK